VKNVLSLIIVLSLPFAASAEMYRWVDSQGKVHYSDSPPPAGAKSSKTIDTPPPSAAPSGAAPKAKTWQEKEMDFRQRQAAEADAQAKKQKEEAEAKERKQNCENARKSLASLESGTRIVTTDEKGERVYMDDSARAAAISEARKAVENWCK
jgi:hypothetical protein